MTFTHELKLNEVKAPVLKGDRIGTVLVKNQNGEVVKEEIVTVRESIEKASIWDLWKRNFRFISSGI